MSDAAIAVIDEQGTAVGWTRAAERLVGHSAEDVVGRSAAVVLSPSQDALRVPAFAEQRRAQGGWSGTVARGTTSPPSHSRVKHTHGAEIQVMLTTGSPFSIIQLCIM